MPELGSSDIFYSYRTQPLTLSHTYYKVPLWDVPGGAAQDLIEEERPNLTEASNIHARPYNITVLGPSILCSKQPSTWV